MNGSDRPFALLNARIVDPASGFDGRGGLLIENGTIRAVGSDVTTENLSAETAQEDARGAVIAPGLIDMRVFTGEPGQEHRETLASATEAAAAGGVTTIIRMPDTDPVVDDPALVAFVLARAKESARVRVRPAAALTRGLQGAELAELGLLREAGAAFFSQGRRPLASARLMRRALTYARDFDVLVEHLPHEQELVGEGVMNEGETATRLGLGGIPTTAETVMLERDVRLAQAAQARYHAALVSSGRSLDILRRVKGEGARVTAGVSINSLSLNENDIGEYRTFFKLSPPLRTEDDRLALVEGLRDGTIDVVTSSHDPQDADRKRRPFAEAADGAVGLETLLPAGLRLVHDGSISLLRLIETMTLAPARLLGLDEGRLSVGSAADLAMFDLDAPWALDATRLRSRSQNTPFDGARFTGRVLRAYVSGRLVYNWGPGV